MRVVQINTTCHTGSTGKICVSISEILSNIDVENYIIYTERKSDFVYGIKCGNYVNKKMQALKSLIFGNYGFNSKKTTKQIIKQIEKIKPNIVHIHNIHGYFLNYKILFDYLSKAGIPVIWTVHDCWLYTGHCYYYSFTQCDKWRMTCNNCPQRLAFPTSFFIDRSKQNFFDKQAAFCSMPKDKLTIVPVSKWIRGEMQQSFLKDYNYQVIHNGIDTDTFNIYDTEAVKAKYNLTGKHIILGVASIWSEEKGLNDFVRMAPLLHDEEVIVLVGIKEEEKRLLPNNIVPIARTENIRQLAELYAAADAFVNPTWQDNYPTVNMEAIACGTPVVTYRTGGSIETITPDTGIIVEQGNVQGLLNAARSIRAKGKEYYQPKCRGYALAYFKKEERYTEYLELYNKVVLNY